MIPNIETGVNYIGIYVGTFIVNEKNEILLLKRSQ